MKIAIGCDPNAMDAKRELITFIQKKGYGDVTDFGSSDTIYANVAFKLAKEVAKKNYDFGILICGTGLGMTICANKIPGAYAALLTDNYSAKRARLSNNSNIACLGAFTIGSKLREELIETFLTTEYIENTLSQEKINAYQQYDKERIK